MISDSCNIDLNKNHPSNKKKHLIKKTFNFFQQRVTF